MQNIYMLPANAVICYLYWFGLFARLQSEVLFYYLYVYAVTFIRWHFYLFKRRRPDQTFHFISFMLHVLFEDSRDTVTLTLWSGGVE